MISLSQDEQLPLSACFFEKTQFKYYELKHS